MLTSFQGMKLTILEALQTHRHKEQTCGFQGGRGKKWDGMGTWGW